MGKVDIGDYVAASKYSDGDVGDHFVVGFYDGFRLDRHFVKDGEGNQFRGNGFRRVKKISHNRGVLIANNLKEISQGTRSFWWWVCCAPSAAFTNKDSQK